jgi:hypothetical protein
MEGINAFRYIVLRNKNILNILKCGFNLGGGIRRLISTP